MSRISIKKNLFSALKAVHLPGRIGRLVEDELLFTDLMGSMPGIAKYAFEETASCKVECQQQLALGVVGGYPLLQYVKLGYDWLASYYNPAFLFREVHYFQTDLCRHRVLEWGYDMHVHGSTEVNDVIRVCSRYGIDILRSYDSVNGRIAIEAGHQLNIPVIVSEH